MRKNMIAPKDIPYPMGYHKKFHIRGINYKCKLDPLLKRQDAIAMCRLDSEIYLKRYLYKGKPAYMIVLAEQDIDIGVVPAELVPTIEKYKDRESRIVITNIYDFENDDKTGVEVQFQVKKKMPEKESPPQNDTPLHDWKLPSNQDIQERNKKERSIKLISTNCPNCGATLQISPDNEHASCQHCGSAFFIDDGVSHIQYDNAEEAGYQFEKGRQRAIAESSQPQDNYAFYNIPTDTQQKSEKKRRTWLWVLGWIFFFPAPVMVLIWRNKNSWNLKAKIGVTVAFWILIFSFGSTKDNNSENTPTDIVESSSKQVMSSDDADTSIASTEKEAIVSNDITENTITEEPNSGVDEASTKSTTEKTKQKKKSNKKKSKKNSKSKETNSEKVETIAEEVETVTEEPTEELVWIDDTGAKYHSKSSCSNMDAPYQVTISEAIAQGRDACKKCY